MSDFSMEDAGDQFEDDLLKAMQNSLEVNTVPLPAATQPNPAYRGMYNFVHGQSSYWTAKVVISFFGKRPY